MIDKRIIFKNADGSCGVIIPAPEAMKGKDALTIEAIAAKDVPAGKKHRICTTAELPQSRNYRNAWTDDNPTQTVDIDLEKAKPIQRQLMIEKAMERTAKDEFGEQDLNTVKAEINAIDVNSATTLDELYNMWPASIERRQTPRSYGN
jgi:multidrug efflux pump subunit AcrB